MSTFTNKEWGSFREFNTVIFKPILLQLVLWNKQAHLKDQDYNGFLHIKITFKFSQINHIPLVIMDDWYKCCEINTMSLTYGSLQVLLWNNDATIKKINSCNWCRQITDFFKYIHSWNQEGIIISNYDISSRQHLLCENTVNLKKILGCNCSFVIEKGSFICRMGTCNRNFDLTQYFSNMCQIRRIKYAIQWLLF